MTELTKEMLESAFDKFNDMPRPTLDEIKLTIEKANERFNAYMQRHKELEKSERMNDIWKNN